MIFPLARVMEIKTIVDAGPLIGWFNAGDQWHQWSVSVLSRRRGALHTTEIVLGEACWHLGGNTQPVHALLDLVRKHALVLARPWPDHLADAQRIMLKYPAMDAADASLVVLAEASRAILVSTDRRDFESCRGLHNRPLKLILPE
jgi:predicted nucleic acid-binding protein